jgi:hypothetical protein
MRLSGSRRGPLVSSIAWRFSLRSARLAFCTLLNVVTGGMASRLLKCKMCKWRLKQARSVSSSILNGPTTPCARMALRWL